MDTDKQRIGYEARQKRIGVPRNTPALLSLLCGLLVFVPLVSSVLAILLGTVGIKRSRKRAAGGHGFAVAGLCLGILGTVFWSCLISYCTLGYLAGPSCEGSSRALLSDLGGGRVKAAMAICDGPSASELEADSRQLVKCGPPLSIAFSGCHFIVATRDFEVFGSCKGSRGSFTFTIFLKWFGGRFRVEAYFIQMDTVP
jgi:hypothetical protein